MLMGILRYLLLGGFVVFLVFLLALMRRELD